MTGDAASLVLASLPKVIRHAQSVDAIFNDRLLDTHPEVYRRFAIHLPPNERSFVRALRPVLENLGSFGAILPTVRALAETDKVYSLVDANYVALSETLIWTLRRCLGPAFTVEIERAWWATLRAHSSQKSSVC